MTTRRAFVAGLAGVLAAGVAPTFVQSGLMHVRPIESALTLDRIKRLLAYAKEHAVKPIEIDGEEFYRVMAHPSRLAELTVYSGARPSASEQYLPGEQILFKVPVYA